jgi:hypothetical protein
MWFYDCANRALPSSDIKLRVSWPISHRSATKHIRKLIGVRHWANGWVSNYCGMTGSLKNLEAIAHQPRVRSSVEESTWTVSRRSAVVVCGLVAPRNDMGLFRQLDPALPNSGQRHPPGPMDMRRAMIVRYSLEDPRPRRWMRSCARRLTAFRLADGRLADEGNSIAKREQQ